LRCCMDLDKIVDELLNEMNETLKRVGRDIEEMVREMKAHTQRVRERPMVFGFTFGLRDDRPELRTFGDLSVKGEYRVPVYEQVVDEARRELRVVLELPGIEREGIRLEVSTEYLRLEASTGERKYRANVRLKRAVDPRSASARFVNGVLEVNLKLKGEEGGEFTPVRVD
jgi:HSP20 family protein